MYKYLVRPNISYLLIKSFLICAVGIGMTHVLLLSAFVEILYVNVIYCYIFKDLEKKGNRAQRSH